MKQWIQKLKQILFPPHCIICQDYLNPDTAILFCPDCLKLLPYIPSEHCPVCGNMTATGDALCFDCHTKKPPCRKHKSVLFYTEEIRSAVLRFKFHRKRHFAVPIGSLMSSYVTEEYDLITAVPISKQRLRKRGYNQSKLLAEQIERLRRIPYQETLKKIKNTPPQSKLGYRRRQENLRNAFSVVDSEAVKGKRILLIDDICTTGATINECSKTLMRAGAQWVDAITFARTDKRIKSIKGTND